MDALRVRMDFRGTGTLCRSAQPKVVRQQQLSADQGVRERRGGGRRERVTWRVGTARRDERRGQSVSSVQRRAALSDAADTRKCFVDVGGVWIIFRAFGFQSGTSHRCHRRC